MVSRCQKVSIGITIGLGSVLLIIGVVLGFKVFPDMIQELVAENVLLKKGSQSWGVWQKLPIPLNFEVYFFNVTNVEEINEGKMPVVQEVGPYIYKEWRVKEQINVHEECGTASYYQRTTFEFDKEASGELQDTDNVTIFNVAMMGIVETAELKNIDISSDQLNSLFPNSTDIFLTDSVKNILFDGVEIHCKKGFDLVCYIIGLNLPATIKKGPGNNFHFSLFDYKNDSYDGLYEVKLGWGVDGPNPSVEGARLLGKIVKWQNSTTLNNWSGKKCNEITGTDAAIFPPFLTKDSRIDIFTTDLCRSLYALYDRDSSYKGIDSLRFTAHEKLLGDVNTSPDNYCYCPPDNSCLKKGALDLTPCQGAPAILTFPHFYMASEDYLDKIGNLHPNKEKHETFLEIEPNTGVPLRGGKKVQFNMLMKKYPKLSQTHNVTTALFPILWINEGLQLDDNNVNKLKTQLVNNLKIVTAVTWTLIGVGIALTCIGIALLLWVKLSKRSSKSVFST